MSIFLLTSRTEVHIIIYMTGQNANFKKKGVNLLLTDEELKALNNYLTITGTKIGPFVKHLLMEEIDKPQSNKADPEPLTVKCIKFSVNPKEEKKIDDYMKREKLQTRSLVKTLLFREVENY